jgi:hypothetical protein
VNFWLAAIVLVALAAALAPEAYRELQALLGRRRIRIRIRKIVAEASARRRDEAADRLTREIAPEPTRNYGTYEPLNPVTPVTSAKPKRKAAKKKKSGPKAKRKKPA